MKQQLQQMLLLAANIHANIVQERAILLCVSFEPDDRRHDYKSWKLT